MCVHAYVYSQALVFPAVIHRCEKSEVLVA